MVSLEILSIRNRCLPRSIAAACRRELWDPTGNRKVPNCHVQQNVFSQWSSERVVRTWLSDNGTKQTNQSGIAATCTTRAIASGVCMVTGACSGPCPAYSCTLGVAYTSFGVETLLDWTNRGVHCMLRTCTLRMQEGLQAPVHMMCIKCTVHRTLQM